MKALVCNPYWDTLGGGERYTAAFIALLLARGWQVHVAWPTDISASVSSRFCIRLTQSEFGHQFSSLTSANYDLLFWVSDGSLPASLAKRTLIHFQFPFTAVGGRTPLNFIKSRRYSFISNSRFTKSFIDSEFAVTSQVIYPPVTTSAFHSMQKSRLILYVGRFSHLTQAKNPHLLIDAFRQFHSQQPGWKLVLAGGAGVGTDQHVLADLQSRCQGLPVSIITNPTLAQLKKLYGTATFFWSAVGLGVDERHAPLKVEHFGITPVEAMAAGCIPILPALGGHKEIVDSGQNGYLYNSLDQLSDITLNIIGRPAEAKRLAQAAIHQSKLFDVHQFNVNFSQLLAL